MEKLKKLLDIELFKHSNLLLKKIIFCCKKNIEILTKKYNKTLKTLFLLDLESREYHDPRKKTHLKKPTTTQRVTPKKIQSISLGDHP